MLYAVGLRLYGNAGAIAIALICIENASSQWCASRDGLLQLLANMAFCATKPQHCVA